MTAATDRPERRSSQAAEPAAGHLPSVSSQSSEGLAEGLGEALDRLDRWFEGRYVAEPSPDDEVIPAARYGDAVFLEAAIVRARSMQPPVATDDAMASPDGADLDLRIAVSRFTRQYSSSLSAVALVALANGVGLDLSPDRCRLIVRSNIPFLTVLDLRPGDVVRCSERPTTWRVDGPILDTVEDLRSWVWRRLYGNHLGPLLERIRRIAHVSPNLMWSNAAEWVANVSDAADEYLSPEEARPYVADRRALLAADRLPGIDEPNPMAGLIEWRPVADVDFPNGLQTRRVCCITYFLPDRLGRLCQNCPFLGVDDRIALVRERHGVPMTAPGGPAAQRAIEVGMAKVRSNRAAGGRG